MGNTKHTKEQIRERIQQKKLLFDGAFGTYYGGKYDTKQLPELANLEAPERVKEIRTSKRERRFYVPTPSQPTASAWIGPKNRSRKLCEAAYAWRGRR